MAGEFTLNDYSLSILQEVGWANERKYFPTQAQSTQRVLRISVRQMIKTNSPGTVLKRVS
jgi:hypothetical protein